MTRVLSMIALLLALSSLPALSQEKTLRRNQVPKAVLDAFTHTYPNATIKGFSKEVEKGLTTYEVESVEGTTHRDVTYGVDGWLISVEESMAVADLPQPVKDALAKDFPKGKVSTCEKVMKGSSTQYELLVRTGKKSYELVYNGNGTLAEKEKK